MLTSSDFKELLNLFGKHEVRYLVVGGYAVMKYSEPRFTKDLDLWIAADLKNAEAVYAALKEFGAPLANLTPEDFTQEGYFYQMGRPPLRVDIMMSIPGVRFEEAWKNRVMVELEDLRIPFNFEGGPDSGKGSERKASGQDRPAEAEEGRRIGEGRREIDSAHRAPDSGFRSDIRRRWGFQGPRRAASLVPQD